jgi:hypothetical protein
MSNDLTPFGAAGVLVKEARRVGQAISHVQANGLIRQAAVDAEHDVANAKEEAVTDFDLGAMGAMARIGMAEQTAVLNLPGLSGRMAGLAERHTLATYGIHDDLTHRVRKL